MATTDFSMPTRSIRPHPGNQELFLAASSDIAIYGGAAGGGKTYALELEPLRFVHLPSFRTVILRRTSPEITKAGGLWDLSHELYPLLGGTPRETDLTWTFPSGAEISFGHIEHEKDLMKWHSSQIALIEFDELTTFTEKMMWYMLSRNRSMCGVKPYMRATCNPDASSFVASLINWWVDPDTGYAIPGRSGVVRWLIRLDRTVEWFDTREAAVAHAMAAGVEPAIATQMPKSLTFIPATLDDNPTLVAADPGYKANLLALPPYDRERLLGGNWKSRPESGEFPPEWFQDCWFERWPQTLVLKTMALDPSKGRSDKSGDYQALVKVGVGNDDAIYVEADMQRRPIPQMVADCVGEYRDFMPHAFGVEANAFQELLAPDFAQEFERQNVLAPDVWQINNTVNKMVRIRRLAGYLSAKRIRFKLHCPGTQILVNQLMDFPGGDHDDGPDALEMAIRLGEQLSNGG